MNGCVILEGMSHWVVIAGCNFVIVSAANSYCFGLQSLEPALGIGVDMGLRL
jgi:hypothetical protein